MGSNPSIILKSVSEDRIKEDSQYVPNKAICRYDVLVNDKQLRLWLVIDENTAGITFKENLGGDITIDKGNKTTLKRRNPDITFSRDSDIGGKLRTADSKNFIYTNAQGKKIKYEILSCTEYNPFIGNGDAKDVLLLYYQDNNIELKQKFRNLKNALLEIESNVNTKEDHKEKDIDDIDEFLNSLQTIEYPSKVHQHFIISDAELRFQPTLNKVQEIVKRSHYYDNSVLIIEGGPGTGKTTSLIQRIKYLTSYEVLNEKLNDLPNMSVEIINQIINRQYPKWIFFSPNELLYLYLKGSMSKEGLIPTDSNVKVWKEHKLFLMKQYGLFNSDGYSPFLRMKDDDETPLIKNSSKACTSMIHEFEIFFLKRVSNDLDKLKIISFKNISWFKNYQVFIKDLQEINFKTIDEYINFLIQSYNNYYEGARQLKKPFSEFINRATAKRMVAIKNDKKTFGQLTSMFQKIKKETIATEPDEDTEVLEDEEDELKFKNELDKWVFNKLKGIINHLCLKHFDRQQTLSKINRRVNEIAKVSVTSKEIESIGHLSLFNAKIYKWTTGLTRNLFNLIPGSYKNFRKLALNDKKDNIYELSQLKKIISNGNNRIHRDEQAFLIGIANVFTKWVLKRTNNKALLNHSFPSAYGVHFKFVVAVDEASDFHPIDLFAMNSLLHDKVSSMTLAGDLMQKLTYDGLDRWNELKFIGKTQIKSLDICYRQSPTLFSIASEIFKKAKGRYLDIKVDKEPFELEPKALRFVSKNIDDKIKWVAERILEIYTAYQKVMPSIAIFTTETKDIDDLAMKLGSYDSLHDIGIEIVPCKGGKILGNKNSVRIFDLEHIKGLEFEAVFFFDLDKILLQKMGKAMLLRNIYVGLSRATYYTGIILNNEFDGDLSFLNDHFVNNVNWNIK